MIPVVPRDGRLLPSFTQEALWFLDQLERDEATYTIYSPLRVRGPLNVATTERALNEIARRHEILRTTFPEVEGRPVQRIAPYAPRPLPIVDFSRRPAAVREIEARQWIFEEMGRPIDLKNGPLIRITLLRLADDDHMVVVSTHHIIYDGWSMGVLIRELTVLYTAFELGHPSPLRDLPIQYADFAAWQRQYLQGETFDRLRGYWVQQLQGVAPLEMPTDYPRPAIRTTRGATRAFRLSPALSQALLEFCRREGTTPFMTLLATLKSCWDATAARTISPSARPWPTATCRRLKRSSAISSTWSCCGAGLAGDPTFREMLKRVQQTALDAFEHQEMTLDQVVEAVNPPRDMSRHPLFQVMFALQNIELPSRQSVWHHDRRGGGRPAARSAFFDLTLAIWQAGTRLLGGVELPHRAVHGRDDRPHDRALGGAAGCGHGRQPDRPMSCAALLAPGRAPQILDVWNGTAAEYGRDQCLHQQFAEHARRDPAAVAVVRAAAPAYGELTSGPTNWPATCKPGRRSGGPGGHLPGAVAGVDRGHPGRAQGGRGLRAAGSGLQPRRRRAQQIRVWTIRRRPWSSPPPPLPAPSRWSGGG